MSMMSVPSLPGGTRTLPAEFRAPYSQGYNRLRANLVPLTDGPSKLSGVGYYDAEGVWQPDESPYDVVMSDPSYGGGSDVNWGQIIGQSSADLAKILAITQGGSYSATGNVYGSPTTASIAAGIPPNQLSISGQGVSGILSSPMLLLGIGAALLFVLAKK